MSATLRMHRAALAAAWQKLLAQRWSGFAAALAIGIGLALPAGGYALLASLRPVVDRVSLDPRLTVYLQDSLPRGGAVALRDRLRGDTRVRNVVLLAKEDALRTLQSIDSAAELLRALGGNPLPDALVVTLKELGGDSAEALAGELRKEAPVSAVDVEAAWARRLAALSRTGEVVVLLLAALLGTGLVAVTFNTIRLQLLTQQDEIEVSRLIGATDAHIRRPFYYFGLIQGLSGGALALGIVAGGLAWLNRTLADLTASYGSDFRFSFFSASDAVSVLALAGLLGWLGAYVSTQRALSSVPN